MPETFSHPSLNTRSRLQVWALFFFALAIVLCVPYFIPQQPSNSYSWLFGYNNRAAVALIVLLSAAGAVLTRGRFISLRSGTAASMPLWPLWASLVYAAFVGTNVYRTHGHAGGFGESDYSIHRVWLITLGKHPYTDFEWPFGVAQLYVPYLLHHAFKIGIEPAVYLYWAAAAAVGIVLLYVAIRALDYPTPHKVAIYLLMFLLTVYALGDMGPQYTLLRYSAPICGIVLGFKSARNITTWAGWIRWIATTWAVTAVLFLISPESALAYALASLLLTLPRSVPDWPQTPKALYPVLCTGLIVIYAVAARLHEFDTLKSSGGGAESFPVLFSIWTVIVMVQIAICSGAAYKMLTGKHPVDSTLALIALNLFLLPAAFGRADPGHELFNTLPITLAAFTYLSTSWKMWRWYALLWLVMAYAVPTIFAEAAPTIHKINLFFFARMNKHYEQNMDAAKLPSAAPSYVVTAQPVPDHIDFASVYPGIDFTGAKATLNAPFGYMPRGWPVFYLSTQIDYGYYKGIESANSVVAIERRIAELKAHPERNLLVAKGSTDCQLFDARGARKWLEGLNETAYWAHPRHLESPLWPLCQYIQSRYTMVVPASAENWNYELWVPR